MSSQAWYNQADQYGKPHTHESTDLSGPSVGKRAATGALKVAGAAGRGIAKGAKAVSNFAANNPWGIRIFSFAAAVALLVVAILGLVGVVGSDSKDNLMSFYLFNTYMLFLTSVLFIAECKDEWPLLGRIRSWVMEQFGFFQSNLGRGVFLVFVGLVWLGAWGWKWGLLGFAVILVGLMYVIAHMTGSGLPASDDSIPAVKTVVSSHPLSNSTKHVALDEEDDSDIP